MDKIPSKRKRRRMNPSGSESSEEEQRRLSQMFWQQSAAAVHQPASGSSSAFVLGSLDQQARGQVASVQNPPSLVTEPAQNAGVPPSLSAAPGQNATISPSHNTGQTLSSQPQNASSPDLTQMILQLHIQMNQLMMQKQHQPERQSVSVPVLNPE